MPKNQLIQQIEKNINLFLEFDFDILYESAANIQAHPNNNIEDIKQLVAEDSRILHKLNENPELFNQFNFTYLNSLNTHLNNFVAQFNSMKSLKKEQLRNQHHQPINQLENINNTLRQSGVYSILSPSIDIPLLESDLSKLKDEASVIVKDAKDNAEIIRGLIPEATATSLSVAIDERAKSLKTRVDIWLIVVVIVLISTSIFSWNFLAANGDEVKNDYTKNEQNSSIKPDSLSVKLTDNLSTKDSNKNTSVEKGNSAESYTLVYWIKRIVVFLPLFYLIVFCIRQYNKERKLLEIYIHKKTISQTLPAYMKQTQKEDIMDEILLRGSSMIFTLPENPDSPIQGSDGIAMNELKSFLDIKDKIK